MASEPGQVTTERSYCTGCDGPLYKFNGKPEFCDPCLEKMKTFVAAKPSPKAMEVGREVAARLGLLTKEAEEKKKK